MSTEKKEHYVEYNEKTMFLKELYNLISDKRNQHVDVLWHILNDELRHRFTIDEIEDLNNFIKENCMV